MRFTLEQRRPLAEEALRMDDVCGRNVCAAPTIHELAVELIATLDELASVTVELEKLRSAYVLTGG